MQRFGPFRWRLAATAVAGVGACVPLLLIAEALVLLLASGEPAESWSEAAVPPLVIFSVPSGRSPGA